MSFQVAYWKEAMDKEYDCLMDNRTWILVLPPPGKKVIQCKGVYRIKYTSKGGIDKYKTRLVAKGYSQLDGIEYTETFNPVIKCDSIQIIFVVVVLRMHTRQFDIGTAHLNVDLTIVIYVRQREGFISKTFPSHMCQLLKSLYGLKQSCILWNHTFDAFLKLYDLTTSDANSCVYYWPTSTNSMDLIFSIFVGKLNGIVCATSEQKLDIVIQHVARMFKALWIIMWLSKFIETLLLTQFLSTRCNTSPTLSSSFTWTQATVSLRLLVLTCPCKLFKDLMILFYPVQSLIKNLLGV